MVVPKSNEIPLHSDEDVVRARQAARQRAMEQGFSLVDRTKIVTAASELARDTVVHELGGSLRLETLNDGPRRGLRLIFQDKGPGIPDIALALKDGYTTGTGLGGARRLISEFRDFVFARPRHHPYGGTLEMMLFPGGAGGVGRRGGGGFQPGRRAESPPCAEALASTRRTGAEPFSSPPRRPRTS